MTFHRRIKRQKKEKKSKSSVASDDEVEFLMAASAAMGVVGGAVNMFNQYQQGKTLANTDWGGMIGDVRESAEANIASLRERANTAFEKLSFDTTQGLKGLGSKATTLADSVGENLGGFVNSGAQEFTKLMGIDEIKQNAMAINKSADIQEEQTQQDYTQQEVNIQSDADSQIADLQSQQSRSQGWYPGKHLSRLFGG
jgi:hypothetical protein